MEREHQERGGAVLGIVVGDPVPVVVAAVFGIVVVRAVELVLVVGKAVLGVVVGGCPGCW